MTIVGLHWRKRAGERTHLSLMRTPKEREVLNCRGDGAEARGKGLSLERAVSVNWSLLTPGDKQRCPPESQQPGLPRLPGTGLWVAQPSHHQERQAGAGHSPGFSPAPASMIYRPFVLHPTCFKVIKLFIARLARSHNQDIHKRRFLHEQDQGPRRAALSRD